MCRKMFYLFLTIIFGLSLSVHAKNIVWVSEWNADASGTPFDQGWIDLLEAQGYTVEADTTGDYMALDAGKIATLEAADLIIISRNSNSGNYADGDEPTQWNSITTPLILMSAYISRNNRWQWINGDAIVEFAAETMLQVVEGSHPVFTSITPVGGQVDVIDGTIDSGENSFVNATDVGNGTLIAQRADNGYIWIAEWAPGVQFYSGTTQIPAETRMLFTAGGGGGQTAGSLNLTPDGQKMFLNAVCYMLGETLEPGRATNPNPTNETKDVCRDVVLSWTPGQYAATHDVYFGTSFDDVNDASRDNDPQAVLLSRDQIDTTYGPEGLLEFGQTYFWRIDEVNAAPDYTIYKGKIWSFTAEPFVYQIENITATASSSHNDTTGPENTINDSGLNDNDQHSSDIATMWLTSATGPQPSWIQYEFDRAYKLYEMWVWNSNMAIEPIAGLGLKDVTIEYSTDANDWMVLTGVSEFNRAIGLDDYEHNTTVAFDGVAAKYVKITANSNWGGMPQYGLSEVRFYYKPVYARQPSPQDEATDVPLDVEFTWRAGREAAAHDVYIDANEQAVTEGTVTAESIPAGACEASYAPLDLELDTTYYWKVVEVNSAQSPASWESDVWSFSTIEYSLVEGFEDYNDTEPYRIFDAWPDGWGVSENGSQVGYSTGPFAEQTIVHSGSQSMPFTYKNTGSATYSEASRTFDIAQDWTTAGIKTLTLWLYGDSDNSAATLHVTVQDSSGTNKTVSHDNAGAVQQEKWQQWYMDLTEFAGVDLSSVKKIYIGIGNATAPQPGVSGLIYVDDIRLYPVSRQPVDPGDEAVEACYAFENNTQDGSGNGRDGTAFGEPNYAQGQSGYGMALEFDGTDDYVDLPIGSVISSLTDCTVATWANFYGDEGAWQRIFDFGTGTTTYMFLSPRMADAGAMRFAIINESSDGESQLDSSTTLPTGWHHVAVVIDSSSKTMQLYLDGTVVASGPTETLPADLGETTQNWLGRSQWAADAYYSGSLDDFCIYNRALSELEVLYLAGNR